MIRGGRGVGGGGGRAAAALLPPDHRPGAGGGGGDGGGHEGIAVRRPRLPQPISFTLTPPLSQPIPSIPNLSFRLSFAHLIHPSHPSTPTSSSIHLTQAVVLVGTLFKDMPLRPSVLDEYRGDAMIQGG